MKISHKPLSSLRDAPSIKFRDNYRLRRIPANNKKGWKAEYVYTGELYFWQNDDRELKRLRIMDAVFAAIMLISFLAVNIPATGFSTYLPAALPGICSLIPLVLIFAYTFEFFKPLSDNGSISVITWTKCKRGMRSVCAVYSSLNVASGIMGIYHIFSSGGGFFDIISALLTLGCAALAAVLFVLHGKLREKTGANTIGDVIEKENEEYRRSHGSF